MNQAKRRILLTFILIFIFGFTACSQLPLSNENTGKQETSMHTTSENTSVTTVEANAEVKLASGLFLKQEERTIYLYFPEMMTIQGLRAVIPAEGVEIPQGLEPGSTLMVSYEGEGTEEQISAKALEIATGGAAIKPHFRIPIEEGVKIAEMIPEARLIDVREPHETSLGVIPGAELIPLTQVDEELVTELAQAGVPLLIYCRSGNRSGQMMAALKSVGAPLVLNIGGIIEYTGETEIPQN